MAVYTLLVYVILNLKFYSCLSFYCMRYISNKNMEPCVRDEKNRTICYCSPSGYTNCSGQNLISLPYFPEKTIILNLSKNNLTYLNITQLEKENYTNVKGIDFSNNNLRGMDAMFFDRFVNIKYLNMETNENFQHSLEILIRSLPLSICDLKLGHMNLGSFNYSIFKPLSGSDLRYLSLRGNNFKVFNSDNLFTYLGNLSFLDLARNHLSSVIFSTSYSLEHLWLMENDLTDIPVLCTVKNESMFPQLQSLILNKNGINKMNMKHINCLAKLQTLNMSDTRVGKLKNFVIHKLISLKTFSIEHMASLTHVQPFAFHSKTLEYLYIRGNRWQFYSTHINISTIFSGCPNLKLLDLSMNFMGKLTNKKWKVLLHGIPKLTYLDISLNYILYMPKAIPELLVGLQQLRMSNNGITNVPPHFFDPLRNLTHLFLNGNKITQLRRDQLPTSKLEHLNLAYNPFVCDCNIVWLTRYLEHCRSILSYYPKHYRCTNQNTTLAEVEIPDGACLIGEMTGVIIECTSVAVVVVLLLISAIYRYRWRLRYLIHILKLNKGGYFLRHCDSCEFPIDVYISCSERDFDFVNANIVERLEADGMITYLSERDALTGGMKIDVILEKIDESRFVVLCLSNSFAQDHWCEYETYMAMQRAVYHGRGMLIIIIIEEIENVNFTNSFHTLIRKYDYIKWGRDEEARSLFWRRLKDLVQQQNISSVEDTSLLHIPSF